jgi:hypothetical protein
MSTTPEERLAALGLELPGQREALGKYRPYTLVGNLLYVSGSSARPRVIGTVPDTVSQVQKWACQLVASLPRRALFSACAAAGYCGCLIHRGGSRLQEEAKAAARSTALVILGANARCGASSELAGPAAGGRREYL